MPISLNGFRVIHGSEVLNALALFDIVMRNDAYGKDRNMIETPKFLEVLAINADGNIISIRDEAWTFQFIPIAKP